MFSEQKLNRTRVDEGDEEKFQIAIKIEWFKNRISFGIVARGRCIKGLLFN